ncbi:acyl-homoserine lactone synthase [Sphingomonas laterariae]|uniref:Acyl-homoserine-lactone synthase n=1 Tax=Edaphosphingomonas laterariae TaxID=861865 RepID=A0A239I3A0_9SPHN|nr:acyl-homoserine-lactone synthase [Sphingomonas laterariae]SNS87961.1 acyl-homoserine lactone synthase [Sphingomonas laterariae]
MLHVLNHAGASREAEILRSMFHARKRVFVDLLKWDVPVLGDLYEVDQFDDAHATYVVLTDEDGEHMASARLLPTTRTHILDGLFPDLCEGDIPRGPQIREITRFCLDRRLVARQRRAVRNQLVTALAEIALGQGITTYTGVADIGWCQQILAMGWRCTPLGLPHLDGRKMIAALAIHIDDETPKRLQDAGVYAMPTVVRDVSLPGDLSHA